MVISVVVVAGGDFVNGPSPALTKMFDAAASTIAADSGLDNCARLGIWPETVVGDLDSVDPALLAEARRRGIEVIDYPTDKDATDLELALELAVARGADELELVAVFGGRLDHELATLGLLASPRWAEQRVSAHDGGRSVWVVRHSLELAERVGQTITLVPFAGDALGVTTSGLEWALQDETLALGTTRGVSNVASGPRQTIELAAGVVLVVVDRRPESGASVSDR